MIGKTFGKWTIQELIDDSGGNGTVWRVSDPEGNRAAIKILNKFDAPAKSQKRRKRFINEIRKLEIVGKLGIRGVMPIIDYDAESEQPWFVMPLAMKLSPTGDRMEWALDTMIQISGIVADLHQEGLVHRDIKPNNILTLDGEATLSDFGLARVADDDAWTKTGEGVGSFGYLAPECVGHSDEPQFKCDVYALAKTAWVLSSGSSFPPNGELRLPEDSLRTKGLTSSSVSVSHLEDLLKASTLRDPADRPTARQFHEGLRACRQFKDATQTSTSATPAARAKALFHDHSARNRRNRQCDELFNSLTEQTQRAFFAAWRDVVESLGWSLGEISGGVGSDEATELTKQGWNFRRYFFKGDINGETYELGVTLKRPPLTGETRLIIGASIAIYKRLNEHVIDSIELETYTDGPQFYHVRNQIIAFVTNTQTQYRTVEKLMELNR